MIALTRRSFLLGSLSLAGLGLLSGCGIVSVPTGTARRVARIGYLSPGSAPATGDPSPFVDAFRQGMRDLGHEEGRDYVLERRDSDGHNERLPELAAELVAIPVDVIVAAAAPGATAARGATDSIPIVMANVGVDPVSLRLVASLARPGGNVTGTVNLNVAGVGKRVELVGDLLPGMTTLAILQDLVNPTPNVDEARLAARSRSLTMIVLPMQQAEDIGPAFSSAKQQHADALLVPGSQFFQSNRAGIVAAAAQHRLPTIYEQRAFAEAGGLMSFGASQSESFRRAASYVDRILQGAVPADLPIEQPAAFDLLINLKTAEALGIAIPPSVLAQATEVIQ